MNIPQKNKATKSNCQALDSGLSSKFPSPPPTPIIEMSEFWNAETPSLRGVRTWNQSPPRAQKLDFNVCCFVGPLPLRFGMSPAEVEKVVGPPCIAAPNWRGVLYYGYRAPSLGLSVGFGGIDHTADHFSFSGGSSVRFGYLDFFSDRFAWRALLSRSTDYHEILGCLVFCDLGIALTGFHDGNTEDLTISMFPKGAWEKYRSKFKAYKSLDNIPQ